MLPAPDTNGSLYTRPVWAALLVVSLLSIFVRLYWVSFVQPPSETLFSDMGGYMARAFVALEYRPWRARHHLEMVLFPYGVHTYYAGLLALVGPPMEHCALSKTGWDGGSLWWMDRAHAVSASLVAPFTFLAAHEVTKRWPLALLAGIGIAIWPELVTFVGFYTSEAPYAVFISASAFGAAYTARTGRFGWFLGLMLGIGMTFRGQMLLTGLLTIGWFAVRRPRLPNATWKTVVSIATPFLLILLFSSIRFHHYTGRFGTVADNGPLARLFAVSDVQRIATEKGRGFVPPARTKKHGFKGTFTFKGSITDAEPLDAERHRIWSSKTTTEKLGLLQRNVHLLVAKNDLWPERNAVRYVKKSKKKNAKRNQWRLDAMKTYQWFIFGLLPLGALGATSSSRTFHPGIELIGIHLFTMVFAAAFFFGEVRYRVPYDSLLFILAAAMVCWREGPRQDRWMQVVLGMAWLLLMVLVLPPYGSNLK